MIFRRGALWALVALLGIVLTALCTWSVMRLTGQRIGLAAQPVAVIRGLAPTSALPAQTPRDHDVPTITRTVTVTRTVAAAPAAGGTTPAAGGTVAAGRVTTAAPTTATAPITSSPPARIETRTITAPLTSTRSQGIRTRTEDGGTDSGGGTTVRHRDD